MASPSLSSIFDYLSALAPLHRRRLYQQPSTSLAIFRRMLPHLAKTIVMSLLYMHDSLPVEDLDKWVKQGSHREKDKALELLELMDMVAVTKDAQIRGKSVVRLARPFVTSLRRALAGSGDHRSFGVPSDKRDPDVDEQMLDDFAKRQWDSILYFVVGSVEPGASDGGSIAAGSRTLLEWGGFVKAHGKSANITQDGFEFLLRDVNTQIWSLLIVYLQNAEGQGMDSIEILGFLFTLGSLEVGKGFSTTNLTQSQKTTLDDLHDLGIVYRNPPGASVFYPTRLAETLNSDSNALSSSTGKALTLGGSLSSDQKGYVVVETNYRVYAYTSNPLRIAILSLFIRIQHGFPNMITGKLTKGSVQNAIKSGITSQQIISYLTAHAHPVMAVHGRSGQANTGHPALPPTVVDQIRLWQIEGDRMKATAGYLFREFFDYGQYEACVKQAETVGVLIWKDDRRRLFFVTRYEAVQSTLQKWSKDQRGTNGNG